MIEAKSVGGRRPVPLVRNHPRTTAFTLFLVLTKIMKPPTVDLLFRIMLMLCNLLFLNFLYQTTTGLLISLIRMLCAPPVPEVQW